MEFIYQVEPYRKTLKIVFTDSLLGPQHESDSAENKPANFLAWLGKTLNGMPPSLCGRQVAGTSSLPVVVALSKRRFPKRANEKLIIR